jgi:hypothetical protein
MASSIHLAASLSHSAPHPRLCSAPPRTVPMPTIPPPIIGAPPVRSTSPSQGQPSTNNFLHEKMPRTEAAAAFPRPPSASHRQASPVVLLLHRCHSNDSPCPGRHLEPCVVDRHHQTLPLTTVPLRLSCAPVETTPPVSPPP